MTNCPYQHVNSVLTMVVLNVDSYKKQKQQLFLSLFEIVERGENVLRCNDLSNMADIDDRDENDGKF